MDNGKGKYTEMDKRWTVMWTVCGIMAAVIVLICGFVFLYQYRIAYDGHTGGGFIPPSFGVVINYAQIAFFALIAAVSIKIIMKKDVSLIAMLLIALILPIVCYNVNKYVFHRNGPLYPLVDEGGLLHFIVLRDFDLDGIEDEVNRLNTVERVHGQTSGSSSDDKVLKKVQLRAYGKGEGLEHIFSSGGNRWKEQIWTVHLNTFGDRELSLTRLELTFNFRNKSDGERARLYIVDKEGEIICELSCEVLSDGGVKTVIDNSNVEGLSEKREIYVKYVLE
jgi:hypothetical protein